MSIVKEHPKGDKKRKEVDNMKTFKEMFIEQLENIGKYQIDEFSPNTLTVWDNEDCTVTHYYFDKKGNLKDIY